MLLPDQISPHAEVLVLCIGIAYILFWLYYP